MRLGVMFNLSFCVSVHLYRSIESNRTNRCNSVLCLIYLFVSVFTCTVVLKVIVQTDATRCYVQFIFLCQCSIYLFVSVFTCTIFSHVCEVFMFLTSVGF